MAKPRPSQALMRQHSTWRLGVKIAGFVTFLLLALALRIWVVEGVKVPDRSISPDFKPGAWVWICKLPWCIEEAHPGAPVLLGTRAGDRILRILAGTPGTSIQGETNGKITGPGFKRRLSEESWFLENATIRIPKKGDSLVFSKLGTAEFDLAMKLYQQVHPKKPVKIRASLWIDNREAPLEKAVSAQINNIPVKIRELGNLNWQEIRLVEMQVLRNEHGSSKVEVRREAWKDSTRVEGIRIHENLYFVVCLKARDCVDSRELGFIPQSRMLGSRIPLSLANFKH
jgi:hypothetical protein